MDNGTLFSGSLVFYFDDVFVESFVTEGNFNFQYNPESSYLDVGSHILKISFSEIGYNLGTTSQKEVFFHKKVILEINEEEVLEKAWKEFDVSLIDMKIEVGITNDYEIVIADVIDNDSWRIWPHGDPKRQLDKQSFRDGDKLTEVQKNYKAVTEYTRKFK